MSVLLPDMNASYIHSFSSLTNTVHDVMATGDCRVDSDVRRLVMMMAWDIETNPGPSHLPFTCPLCLDPTIEGGESPYLICASCHGHPHHVCVGEGVLAKLPGELGWLCPICADNLTLQTVIISKVVDWGAKQQVSKSNKNTCLTCARTFIKAQ